LGIDDTSGMSRRGGEPVVSCWSGSEVSTVADAVSERGDPGVALRVNLAAYHPAGI